MNKESQCRKILAMLKSGQMVTSLSALQHAGSLSLHRRLSDLREQGHRISGAWMKLANGKRVMYYTLDKGAKK